jgi:hypothetical protein
MVIIGFMFVGTAVIAIAMNRIKNDCADTDGEDLEFGATAEDSWYQDDSVEETDPDDEITKKIRLVSLDPPESQDDEELAGEDTTPMDITPFLEDDMSSEDVVDPFAHANLVQPSMPVPITVYSQDGQAKQIFVGLGPETSLRYLHADGGPMTFRDGIMGMKGSNQICLAALSGSVMKPTRVGDVYDAMFQHDDALGCILRLHAFWAEDTCHYYY